MVWHDYTKLKSGRHLPLLYVWMHYQGNRGPRQRFLIDSGSSLTVVPIEFAANLVDLTSYVPQKLEGITDAGDGGDAEHAHYR